MKLEDVEVREDQGEDQGEASYYFAYRPRSDLLILNRGFPRLAVEINSTSPGRLQQDRYRLILQGASVVRYANTHLDDFKEDKDFVFMIIYIGDAGEAERDLLYQTTSDDDAVSTNFMYDIIKLNPRRYIGRRNISHLEMNTTTSNSYSNSITFLPRYRTRLKP